MRFAFAVLLMLAAPVTAQAQRQSTAESAIDRAKDAMQTDPDLANREAVVAVEQAKLIGNDEERRRAIATARWLQGEALLRLNDVKLAAAAIEQALQLSSHLDNSAKLRGSILLTSGGVHQNTGKVTAALSDYQNAFKQFVISKDSRGQSMALTLIASLYNDANDSTSALKYFGQALDLAKNEPQIEVSLYNNRGHSFINLNRPIEAEHEFDKADLIARKMSSPLLRAIIWENLARARMMSGNVAGASAALDMAMKLSGHGDAGSSRRQLVAIAAKVALRKNDIRRAETLIGEYFSRDDRDATTPEMREAHKTAYEIYRATGNDALALQHLTALKRLDDEATALATSTNAALAAARFDFAHQELRIQRLRNEQLQRSVAYEQARARTQRYVFLGGSAATALIIALLSVGLITIRRSRNKVRAANDDLAYTNAALGKALAAKTEFLATTSHEIRTPLNGILGMTQVMLADSHLDDGARDRLKVVQDAGITMRELVDDILDVAKMETGNLTIEEAPFDLAVTMGEATRLWEAQASAKGLTFTRDLTDCPGTIMGDSVRLRQIVFNLLSNAVKFTAQGGVTLTVARRGHDHFRISVADTGIGVPADKRETIFETFRQADTSTTRQFGGTGLGLAICRNLARAMGGEVWVDSEAGSGSTFVVDLPLVETEAPADKDVSALGPRLLILDRNPIARSMLRSVMEPHVGQVDFAGTVDEALATLSSGNVDRLLADEGTLRAAGDAAQALATIAAASSVPIAVLWPTSDEGGLAQARDVTGVQIIAKPIAGNALAAALFGENPSQGGNTPLVTQAA